MFFKAVPLRGEEPPLAGEVGIVRNEWLDPRQRVLGPTSAFLHPLLRLTADGTTAPSSPTAFRAEHRQDASGQWRPYVTPKSSAYRYGRP